MFIYFFSVYTGFTTITREELETKQNYLTVAPQKIHVRGTYQCHKCQNSYRWYRGLHRHLKYECGKNPRFRCPYCSYIGKHRSHVYSHIKSNHRDNPVYALDINESSA